MFDSDNSYIAICGLSMLRKYGRTHQAHGGISGEHCKGAEKAYAIIREESGTHFDPAVVGAFFQRRIL